MNQNLLQQLESDGCVEIALPHAGRLLALAQQFYALPLKARLEAAAYAGPGVLGYYPSEAEAATVSALGIPLFESSRRRGYSSYDFIDNENILAATELFGVNRWPEAPEIIKEACALYGLQRTFLAGFCRRIMQELHSQGKACEMTLECFDRDCGSLMRLLQYGGAESISVSKAHTDYEFLSLIVSDRAGLEVRTPRGQWRMAPCRDGHAVLLAGDMLEVASNGLIKSAMHRVHYDENRRHSVIYFQGLPMNQPLHYRIGGIECAPTFGQHLCGMLVRGAAHLRPQLSDWEHRLGITIPQKNPFQTGKASPDPR